MDAGSAAILAASALACRMQALPLLADAILPTPKRNLRKDGLLPKIARAVEAFGTGKIARPAKPSGVQNSHLRRRPLQGGRC